MPAMRTCFNLGLDRLNDLRAVLLVVRTSNVDQRRLCRIMAERRGADRVLAVDNEQYIEWVRGR